MHKLIRNGVKHHSDTALHIEFSCNPTVKEVAARRKQEHSERYIKQREAVLHSAYSHKRDERRNAQNTKIRNEVGNCEKLF